MVEWSSPLEIAKDAGIFRKVCMAMLGLSSWEVVVQFPFDWSIITCERKAHWPSFLYFYCRYSIWLALIGMNIALNVANKVNCQALFVFNQFTGNTAIGSASTLLMLRTIAVWNRAPLVTVPLVIASLGQWGILFHGITTVRSSWSDAANACVVDAVSPVFLELIYLYTMSLDLVVLVLTTIGLVRSPGRSALWQLLFGQGIIFFLIAFAANMVATIFLLIHLNQIMSVMFTIPAAVASCIVACRLFVSLTNFRQNGVYVQSVTPYATRVATGGGSGAGDVIQGAGKNGRGMGNTLAGIVFRTMGEGVDSMDQAYNMDEPHTRTTATVAALNSKRGHDLGVTSEDAHVVVCVETTVREHDSV